MFGFIGRSASCSVRAQNRRVRAQNRPRVPQEAPRGPHDDTKKTPRRQLYRKFAKVLCFYKFFCTRKRPSMAQKGPPGGPKEAVFQKYVFLRISASWGLLGASWGLLGASWGPLVGLFGPPGGFLGPRARFGSPVGAPSWSRLGGPGRLGAVLGASWAVLGRSWGPHGPSWSGLGGLWGHLEASESPKTREREKH